MLATAKSIMALAKGQIGNKEYPPGSNRVKYNSAYYGREVLGGAFPWCCVFVWWVFAQCHASGLFVNAEKCAYCPTAMNWFKAKGQFRTSNFQYGDVVFFCFDKSRTAGHIGFVESVNSDGTVTCIEGNTSLTSNDNGGAVMRRVRNKACILGVGRPNYTTPVEASTPEIFETSQSGGSGGGGREPKPDYKDKVVYVSEKFATPVVGKSISIDGISTDVRVEAHNIELYIEHEGKIIPPSVLDDITWQLQRAGAPGALKFTVIKTAVLGEAGGFQEGDVARLTVDGTDVFYGFIFTKKRSKKLCGGIEVTAYDQLRYFKNKHTLKYENKKAGEVLKMLAQEFRLNCGKIEDTRYVIATGTEDNKTLFDIIQNALDATLMNQAEMYVLYDDFGKLTLKNTSGMKVNIVIDAQTAENFDYSSSIDENTYNKVKIAFDNDATATRDIYISQDTAAMNRWGVLQYCDTVEDGENGAAKADALLQFLDRKTRKLKISNAIGSLLVRAGTMLVIKLDLGDTVMSNYMMVEAVTHKFSSDRHTMDLSLRGGEFGV
ncbi:MAG: CHAP domain-containing protein [Oscillospiraceae bacterium]